MERDLKVNYKKKQKAATGGMWKFRRKPFSVSHLMEKELDKKKMILANKYMLCKATELFTTHGLAGF